MSVTLNEEERRTTLFFIGLAREALPMSAVEPSPDGESIPLDKIVLYLLAKSSKDVIGNGYKIPISDVHHLFDPLEEELREDFGTRLKFHKSSEEIHSRQIERALNDIIPYKIPVRNPSFSLEISESIRDMALERVTDEMTKGQQRQLDRLLQDSEFREKLHEHTEKLQG